MDLPVFTRCCFCFPLRYGLLAWGYLKLIISAVISLLLLLALVEMILTMYGDTDYVKFFIFNLLLIIFVIDAAMNMLFIVGSHKRNVKLLQIYYMYRIVLWALTLIFLIVTGFMMTQSGTRRAMQNFFTTFISSLLQSYFVLLLRSQIIKLRFNADFKFLNNETDPQCTMKYGGLCALDITHQYV